MSAAQQQLTPFENASNAVMSMRSEFERLLGGVNPERFERAVLAALAQNGDLLNLPAETLIEACRKAAADRLVPDGKEGAIVERWNERTRRKEATWNPMVHGITKVMKLYGGVKSISCELVYEGEPFRILLGDEMRIEHERVPGRVRPGPAGVVGCYIVVSYGAGLHERERDFMTAEQLEAIRMRSPSGKLGKGPWASDWGEMARKTLIHRISKKVADRDGEGSDVLRSVVSRVEEEYDFRGEGSAGAVAPAAQPARPAQATQPQRSGPAAAFHAAAGRVRDVNPETGEVQGQQQPAAPAKPEPFSFITAAGEVMKAPNADSWISSWLTFITNTKDAPAELEAAWKRNGPTLTATAEAYQRGAAEVVAAIRQALGLPQDGVQAGPGSHPLHVPLGKDAAGKPLWGQWAEAMKQHLASRASAAEVAELEAANKVVLEQLAKVAPQPFAQWQERVKARINAITAEASPAEAAAADVNFGD